MNEEISDSDCCSSGMYEFPCLLENAAPPPWFMASQLELSFP